MLFDKRPILLASFTACLLGLLTSCANSPTGKALERSLAADPKLKDNPTLFGGSSPRESPQNQTTAQLPENFPAEIPLYPEAKLEKVESLSMPNTQGQLTSWSSPDPSNAIANFYQKEFPSRGWQIASQPNDEAGGAIVARLNDLQVTVTVPSGVSTSNSRETPSSSQQTVAANQGVTAFAIQYVRNNSEAAAEPSSSPDAKPSVSSETASPQASTSPAPSQNSTDLNKLPQELRQHIQDLAALGVLTLDSAGAKTNSDASGTQFQPSKAITRREFARWLVAANNRIYANRPGQQIRLASNATQAAFQDVSRTDPDFPSIQALAEAGLIPSPLTGDSTAVLFRPDAPLTRENLILWKVPLDTRQPLPSASIDAVKQTWGFQDVAKIDPKAQRAALADFQNGEQSNIRRVFGYTTLFQPKKPVTRAEAAEALWFFGSQGEGISAKEAQQLKSQPTPPAATPQPTPSSSPSQ